MIIPIIVLCIGFNLYLSINLFYNNILLPKYQSNKPTVKKKIIIKLENSVLFIYLRFHNSNNLSLIIMKYKIFQEIKIR